MKDSDEQYNPNEFEDGQAKANLLEPVQNYDAPDGKTYPMSRLDMVSHQWRQTAVQLLKVLDPKAYQKYREMKYKGREKPDLKTRRAAYKFAIVKFLEISYNIPGC